MMNFCYKELVPLGIVYLSFLCDGFLNNQVGKGELSSRILELSLISRVTCWQMV